MSGTEGFKVVKERGIRNAGAGGQESEALRLAGLITLYLVHHANSPQLFPP